MCILSVCTDIGGTIGAEEALETVAMMTAVATDTTTDAIGKCDVYYYTISIYDVLVYKLS